MPGILVLAYHAWHMPGKHFLNKIICMLLVILNLAEKALSDRAPVAPAQIRAGLRGLLIVVVG